MTVDGVLTMIRERPFIPYAIVMADGERIHVRHPEMVATTENRELLLVGGPGGAFSILDIRHITRFVKEGSGPDEEVDGS